MMELFRSLFISLIYFLTFSQKKKKKVRDLLRGILLAELKDTSHSSSVTQLKMTKASTHPRSKELLISSSWDGTIKVFFIIIINLFYSFTHFTNYKRFGTGPQFYKNFLH